MAQLKSIVEVEKTILALADLIESSENSELYKSLRDPLGYALVWCDDLKTDEVTFKDPESIPGQLQKSIEEAVRLISEAPLKPPYQQQVSALVVKLQKLTAMYLTSLDVTTNIEDPTIDHSSVALCI